MIARRNKNRKNLQNMLLKKYPIRPLQVIVTLPVNIKVNLMHKLLEKSFRKNLQKSSPVSLDQDNVKMFFHLYRLRTNKVDAPFSSITGSTTTRSTTLVP
mmetsp:Transcript_48657/g.56863  ORF Transcript_48657/g.56863 Transcript_48657/m.56863 type:complete len:100 (-) Transcript_48657:29-328(-)